MVEVFITNIIEPIQANKIITIIKNKFPDLMINFDLEDCHKILRVEGTRIKTESIISVFDNLGYLCKVLEDRVCK